MHKISEACKSSSGAHLLTVSTGARCLGFSNSGTAEHSDGNKEIPFLQMEPKGEICWFPSSVLACVVRKLAYAIFLRQEQEMNWQECFTHIFLEHKIPFIL